MNARRQDTKSRSVRDSADISEAAKPLNGAVPRIVSGRGSHKCRPGAGSTPEQRRLAKAREDYIAHLRRGITLRGSARLADISFTTVGKWRQIDPAFQDRERDAILDGCASLEDEIRKAAIKDWRAADRLLQVRDPERWAPKKEGADVSVSVNLSSTNPDEELRRVQELERKLLGRVVTEFQPLPGMTASEEGETNSEKKDGEVC
ncbi:MAG: hypothetical protein NW217_01545 [Hyphomicrobiaceae bacterium]|nr:hypothetical protein [Hyphomicrobiaceae bacterium]